MNEKDIKITAAMSDSHFHIMEMKKKDINPQEIFTLLRNGDAGPVLDAGVVTDDFEERLSWGSEYKKLFFAAGIHPNIPRNEWPAGFKAVLKSQIAHDLVKAVGETGLDFYREWSSPEDQYELLNIHYELASNADKPLIFHIRNAEEAMIRWIGERDFPMGGVLHCFPGGLELAQIALEKGLYISFAGNVTFKNAHLIRESLNIVPDDKLLVETDAPYLAPVPRRGKTSHPGMIGYTYDFIARQKEMLLDDLVFQVNRNICNFLKLK